MHYAYKFINYDDFAFYFSIYLTIAAMSLAKLQSLQSDVKDSSSLLLIDSAIRIYTLVFDKSKHEKVNTCFILLGNNVDEH